MKKNIIFFLVKCELGIPHLKNTSKDIIKLSFFSLILLVFSFTNKAFGQASLPVNETFSTVTASGAISNYFNSRLYISSNYLDEDSSIVSRERVNDFKQWLDK